MMVGKPARIESNMFHQCFRSLPQSRARGVGQHLLCSIVSMEGIMNKVLSLYTTWCVVGSQVGSTAV